MQKKIEGPSPALAYLKAAWDALPKSLGDRDSIHAMHQSMSVALASRFQFDKADIETLQRMKYRTCVGNFDWDSENYYRASLYYGGTYARVWEAAHNFKPWIAGRVIFGWLPNERIRGEVREKSRIYEGLGVLMPADFEAAGEGLCSFEGQGVWWCSSVDNDRITLCRYRLPEKTDRHPRLSAYERNGHPARIVKLYREQWEDWQAKVLAPAVSQTTDAKELTPA